MNEAEVLNSIPMRVMAFHKESQGKTRSVVFTREITPELTNARTFGEVYVALVKMKMNLLALGIFEDVELTMEPLDIPSQDDINVFVRVKAKEARPLRIGIQGSVTTTGNDAGIEGFVDYVNPLGLADSLSTRIQYDVLRRNTYYNIDYRLPKLIGGYSLSVNYLKESRNLLKESSVNVFTEGLTAQLASPANRFALGCSLTWRDMAPATDLDVERVTATHCSRSMLRECRPSLKSSLFAQLRFDSRDNPVVPTRGLFARCRLSLSGLLGDVRNCRLDAALAAALPLSPSFGETPGLALHLSSYGGFIRNFGRRPTRYFDRFFLSGEHIRGFETAEIGPRSRPEDGGKPEGDVLGGDRCLAVGAAVSFPVVLNTSGIRGQVFWNMGSIWNRNDHLKKAWRSALESYGVGLMIPFGSVGRLELNYTFSQKRFSFLFCAMWGVFFY
ncbi:hypothetical protein WA588_005409 [Blastocystis sp. NMH]